MAKNEERYTITVHHGTYDYRYEWYSLQDTKENTDVELDIKNSREYAEEVCRKFNKEAKAGLHD